MDWGGTSDGDGCGDGVGGIVDLDVVDDRGVVS